VPEWITANETWMVGLTVASAGMFAVSLVLTLWLIGRLPADYFMHERRPTPPWAKLHPSIRWLALIGKNLLGAVLILAGVAMLVLPGQGLATIAFGLLIMDFPGKYRLQRWLVARPRVARGLNWLRRKGGHPPLHFPERTRRRAAQAGESIDPPSATGSADSGV